jgi:hypothetical protein
VIAKRTLRTAGWAFTLFSENFSYAWAELKLGQVAGAGREPGPLAADCASGTSNGVSASRTVPFGSWSGNVLQTKDYSLIEPKNENKFYAPDVGLVEAISTTGPSEDIQLQTIEHGV